MKSFKDHIKNRAERAQQLARILDPSVLGRDVVIEEFVKLIKRIPNWHSLIYNVEDIQFLLCADARTVDVFTKLAVAYKFDLMTMRHYTVSTIVEDFMTPGVDSLVTAYINISKLTENPRMVTMRDLQTRETGYHHLLNLFDDYGISVYDQR